MTSIRQKSVAISAISVCMLSAPFAASADPSAQPTTQVSPADAPCDEAPIFTYSVENDKPVVKMSKVPTTAGPDAKVNPTVVHTEDSWRNYATIRGGNGAVFAWDTNGSLFRHTWDAEKAVFGPPMKLDGPQDGQSSWGLVGSSRQSMSNRIAVTATNTILVYSDDQLVHAYATETDSAKVRHLGAVPLSETLPLEDVQGIFLDGAANLHVHRTAFWARKRPEAKDHLQDWFTSSGVNADTFRRQHSLVNYPAADKTYALANKAMAYMPLGQDQFGLIRESDHAFPADSRRAGTRESQYRLDDPTLTIYRASSSGVPKLERTVALGASAFEVFSLQGICPQAEPDPDNALYIEGYSAKTLSINKSLILAYNSGHEGRISWLEVGDPSALFEAQPTDSLEQRVWQSIISRPDSPPAIEEKAVGAYSLQWRRKDSSVHSQSVTLRNTTAPRPSAEKIGADVRGEIISSDDALFALSKTGQLISTKQNTDPWLSTYQPWSTVPAVEQERWLQTPTFSEILAETPTSLVTGVTTTGSVKVGLSSSPKSWKNLEMLPTGKAVSAKSIEAHFDRRVTWAVYAIDAAGNLWTKTVDSSTDQTSAWLPIAGNQIPLADAPNAFFDARRGVFTVVVRQSDGNILFSQKHFRESTFKPLQSIKINRSTGESVEMNSPWEPKIIKIQKGSTSKGGFLIQQDGQTSFVRLAEPKKSYEDTFEVIHLGKSN